MNALLTSFAGSFGKSVVVGIYLPVVLVLSVWVLIVEPVIPASISIFQRLSIRNDELTWQVLGVLLVSMIFTALLYNLNNRIVNLLEGYPLMTSFLGGVLLARHAREVSTIDRKLLAAHAVLSDSGINANETLLLQIRARYRELISSRNRFPYKTEYLLPTRLGNIIRAFETYPEMQYGMGGVTLWPALTGVLDDMTRGQIEESRTAFDFTVNSTVICAIGALYGAGLSLYLVVNSLNDAVEMTLSATFVFLLLTVLAYRATIPAAAAWGEYVKRAFDTFREPLLKKYGINSLPKDIYEERRLWSLVTQQILAGDVYFYEDHTPNSLSSKPRFNRRSFSYFDIELSEAYAVSSKGERVKITKGVLTIPALPAGSLRMRIVVHAPEEDIVNVKVYDRTPDQYFYKSGSATLDGQSTEPFNSNLLIFNINNMTAGIDRVLEYEIYKF
ncbi:hypothetical protein [Deinococcus sp. ME38]|uniref:hypothetical protein n=1 Tax=Deinococcus sp. ME38 TaxID=3400344 RepID=UPI003B58DE67